MSRVSGQISFTTLLLFLFGVVFLLVMLFFAVFWPNPSYFQFQVFIVVLGLAAAGIGAVLPGTIGIKIGSPFAVKAGGAVALFVIVLFFRPVLEDKAVRIVRPDTPVEPAVEKFLAALDRGDLNVAWSELDTAAKGVVVADRAQFDQTFKNARLSFGAAAERRLIGTQGAQSPPGLPIGLYQVLTYQTRFSSAPDKCRSEQVTLRATAELDWKVYGYLVGQVPVDCI